MKLDVIINTYNDEDNIESFFNNLKEELKRIKTTYIFIDNGSTDKTNEIIKKIHNNNEDCVKIITLSKKFEEDSVIIVGLRHSTNDLACITDCKYKNNYTYISKMYDYLVENETCDSVCLCNKVVKSKLQIYKEKILNKIFNYKDYDGITNYRMLKRNMINGIIEYSKYNVFNSCMFMEIGFNTHYEKTNRTTNTSLKCNNNYKILNIMAILSLITSIFSIIGILFIIINNLVNGVKIPGYSTIIITVLIFLIIQLMHNTITTELFKNNYLEKNNKILYIIKEKIGFEEEIL